MVGSVRSVLPFIALILNAMVWGLSWLPLRELQIQGIHALWASVATYSVGAVLLLMLRPSVWREFLNHRGLWLLSLAAGSTMVGFNWGVTIADVVRVVLLFYLMPVWTVLFARLLLGECITRVAMFRVLLACFGAVLVLSPEGRFGIPWPSNLGEFLGLIGGVAFALNNVMLRRQAHVSAQARLFGMFMGGVFVPLLVVCVLLVSQRGVVMGVPSSVSVWGGLVLIIFSASLLCANYGLQYGAARLPANITSVVMLSEVVFATFSAMLWGGRSLFLRHS